MRDNVKGGALTEVTFLILLSLYEAKHGYAIMQFIEEQTQGRLCLGAGSLYGAINTLCNHGGKVNEKISLFRRFYEASASMAERYGKPRLSISENG